MKHATVVRVAANDYEGMAYILGALDPSESALVTYNGDPTDKQAVGSYVVKFDRPELMDEFPGVEILA